MSKPFSIYYWTLSRIVEACQLVPRIAKPYPTVWPSNICFDANRHPSLPVNGYRCRFRGGWATTNGIPKTLRPSSNILQTRQFLNSFLFRNHTYDISHPTRHIVHSKLDTNSFRLHQLHMETVNQMENDRLTSDRLTYRLGSLCPRHIE